MVTLILRAVAVGTSIAGVVLIIMNVVELRNAVILIALATACLAISSLPHKAK